MNKSMTAVASIDYSKTKLSDRSQIEQALLKFDHMQPSGISSHSGRCCQIAREWFRAQSRAHNALQELPSPWFRERWVWGPLERPIHWCEIVERKTIDCAALATMAAEGMDAIGQPVLLVQILEIFDDHTVQNWAYHWREHGGGYWISSGLVYHEVIAVKALGPDPGIRIWDSTEECYCEQRPLSGHGAVVAVRVLQHGESELATNGVFNWRGIELRPNEWSILTD